MRGAAKPLSRPAECGDDNNQKEGALVQLDRVEPAVSAPPQNPGAEEHVLGALMIAPSTIDKVAAILDPDDFYIYKHGWIYQVILDLHAKRSSADALTVTAELLTRGQLDQAGGRPYIYTLANIVPATANVEHWAELVLDASRRRRLILFGQQITQLGKTTDAEVADLEAKALKLTERISNRRANESPFRVVTLDEFVGITEDTSEPLIGVDANDTLLPADGLLLMYGDGGAGKTTLSIDALAHIASGTPWLGEQIPTASNVLLIENEGPRGPFRQTLAKKIARWSGSPFSPRVRVLEEPWTQFTLSDPVYRAHLAQEIANHQIDAVIVGPLASLGAKGTGTPDEVTDFANFISDLRSLAGRPFALWIVHHENKAGDVSGAWERLPDTLVHVSAQGNGKTRVHWRKARWSSRLHNTSVHLLWDDGGFAIEEAKVRDLPAELLVKFAQIDGRWLTVKQAKVLIGANEEGVKTALQQLTVEGKMIYEVGPQGRAGNAKCWRLRTASDPSGHPEALDLFKGGSDVTASLPPSFKEAAEARHSTSGQPTASDPPRHPPAEDLDWADQIEHPEDRG